MGWVGEMGGWDGMSPHLTPSAGGRGDVGNRQSAILICVIHPSIHPSDSQPPPRPGAQAAASQPAAIRGGGRSKSKSKSKSTQGEPEIVINPQCTVHSPQSTLQVTGVTLTFTFTFPFSHSSFYVLPPPPPPPRPEEERSWSDLI